MIRFIFYSLLVYFIIKVINNIYRYLVTPDPSSVNNKVKNKSSKYKIDKDDVIDAHFEDLDSKSSDKTKNNS